MSSQLCVATLAMMAKAGKVVIGNNNKAGRHFIGVVGAGGDHDVKIKDGNEAVSGDLIGISGSNPSVTYRPENDCDKRRLHWSNRRHRGSYRRHPWLC